MGKTENSKSRSINKSKLSSLAMVQEDILKEREDIFQSYYLPEFKDFYTSLSPDSAAGNAQMGVTAKGINDSFDSAQKQTNQRIAQQNLGGSGAGLALIAANNRERSSALASAYANQMAASKSDKGNALAQIAQLMPSTTTVAPVLDDSTSKSTGYGSFLSQYI